MVRKVLAAVAATLALAGCGAATPNASVSSQAATEAPQTTAAESSLASPSDSAVPSTAPSPTLSSPAAQPAAAAVNTAAAKPLSFYAHQYETIVAPTNKALDSFDAVPSTAPTTEQQKYATALSDADTTAANALLRATWPNAQTTQDIRSLARAIEAVATDLQGINQLGSDTVAHDAGAENAAITIVHADLGLPPATK